MPKKQPASEPLIVTDTDTRLIVQHPTLSDASVATFARVLGRDAQRREPALAQWDQVTIDPVQLLRLAESQQVDAQLVPTHQSLGAFRLLACDMDSTLITIECIDEIADLAGQGQRVAEVTAAAMRGEIDFATSLRERVAHLEGAPASIIEQVLSERMTLSPGAEQLIQAARQAGLLTMIVSGGFVNFAQPLAEQLQMDRVVANTLEIADDRLTGRLSGPIIDPIAKRDAVMACLDEIGGSAAQTIVVGDGANDLPMMAVAGVSVAYRAKPIVRSESTRAINHCGLAAILNFFSD